jgi:hypothetical protein
MTKKLNHMRYRHVYDEYYTDKSNSEEKINRPYKLASMTQQDFIRAKKRARISFRHQTHAGHSGKTCYHGNSGNFSKEEIERFPKYLRRGGEYEEPLYIIGHTHKWSC